MASIIAKVTELDKEMRLKIKQLQQEKEQLPVFLREQKKKLTKKTEEEAHQEIETRKKEIEEGLKAAKAAASNNLKKNITKIEAEYKEKKDQWIETIYRQCIQDYLED